MKILEQNEDKELLRTTLKKLIKNYLKKITRQSTNNTTPNLMTLSNINCWTPYNNLTNKPIIIYFLISQIISTSHFNFLLPPKLSLSLYNSHSIIPLNYPIIIRKWKWKFVTFVHSHTCRRRRYLISLNRNISFYYHCKLYMYPYPFN